MEVGQPYLNDDKEKVVLESTLASHLQLLGNGDGYGNRDAALRFFSCLVQFPFEEKMGFRPSRVWRYFSWPHWWISIIPGGYFTPTKRTVNKGKKIWTFLDFLNFPLST